MPDIILHHYEASPFSEKIRAILGYKKLAWKSVIISPIMPRPQLMPLTGGYRKTPVMQIGADIYCDTAIIAAKLDQIAPEPGLYPEDRLLTAKALASWADSQLFRAAVGVCFQPRAMEAWIAARGKEEVDAFLADRAKLAEGGSLPLRMDYRVAETALRACLGDLSCQLSKGGVTFLLGNRPCIADFAVYHCLWFVRGNQMVAQIFENYPQVEEWMAALRILGHGGVSPLSAEEALLIGKDSMPQDDAPGGREVAVAATDYGVQKVRGRLLLEKGDEVVVAREDETAGRINVHFPGVGFSVSEGA